MIRKFYELYIIQAILAFAITFATAQEELPPEKVSSFEGRHFFVGFMQNEIANDPNGLIQQIYITSTREAEIIVSIPDVGDQTYNIREDSVLLINVPEELESNLSETVEQKTVEITSDVPITVYCFSSQSTTSDSYAAIPVSHWGNEYVVTTFPNDQYAIEQPVTPLDSIYLLEPRTGEFLIMAGYDNTRIEFKPAAITRYGKQYDRYTTIILHEGESYLVQSVKAQMGQGDLTGSHIRSDKPIGVLSGHVRTAVPHGLRRPFDSKDHLIEMLPPAESWGKDFITVPFDVCPFGDYFRVVTLESGTVIDIEKPSGPEQLKFTNGKYVEIVLNEPAVWKSNKPIQVSQMMMHTGLASDNYFYDPCLVIVPPVEQYVSRILFQTPGNSVYNPYQFDYHYISIIADEESLESLALDGRAVDEITPIRSNNLTDTDLYWARIKILDGVHELKCRDGRFAGTIFGYGEHDSYGMTLGASLTNPFVSDTISPQIDVAVDCGELTGLISEVVNDSSSGIDYVIVQEDSTYNYEWEIEEVSDTANYVGFTARPKNLYESGEFVIDVRDKNGNGKRYGYYYDGFKIDIYDDVIDFGIATLRDSLCKELKFINRGLEPVTLDSAAIKTDSRLYLFADEEFPIVVEGGEVITLTICLSPQGDSNSVAADLYLYFECDHETVTPINAFVESTMLEVANLDFGDVRVGEEKCDSIWIFNPGNVPITIDSLEFAQSTALDYDTTGVFPIVIPPGDTLFVDICFTPTEQIDYSSNFTARNNRRISNSGNTQGRGVMPIVESISVNWFERRVGTTNDSVVVLENVGTDETRLTFDRFVENSDAFDHSSLSSIDTLINPGETIEIPVSFLPADRSDYRCVVALATDYSLHAPIEIELLGAGTLPAVETFDVDFGEVFVYTRKDSTPNIIFPGGNEDLVVDMFDERGDAAAFFFDRGDPQDLTLTPGEAFALAIGFRPEEVRAYSDTLFFEHPSLPDYALDTSIVVIRGVGIPSDTLEAMLEVDAPASLFSCNDSIVYVRISSRGNYELSLVDYQIIGDDDSVVEWIAEPTVPTVLERDLIYEYSLGVSPKRGDRIDFDVLFDLKDTVLTESVSIQNETLPLQILELGKVSANPGDTMRLSIGGSLPYGAEEPFEFSLDVFIDRMNFELIQNQGRLKIKSDDFSDEVPVNLDQMIDRINAEFTKDLQLSGKGPFDWTLELEFLALFNTDNVSDLRIETRADDCYDPATYETTATVAEVCVQTLRGVMLDLTTSSLTVDPNPASSELRMELYLPYEDAVEIAIFDASGKKYRVSRKLFLKKGFHSLIFEIMEIPNGIYTLSLQTSVERKNIIFVISK